MSQLLEHRLLDEHQYAIVDQLTAGELPAGLPLIELVPDQLRSSSHLLPWLVPLRQATDAQLNALLETVHAAPTTGDPPHLQYLLSTTADTETVQRRATRRLLLSQAGEGRFLLRYYDPHVWAQMLWMLSPEQLAYWFYQTQRISFWLRGQWHTTAQPGQITAARMQARLDTATFAQVARIGAINRVLNDLEPAETLQQHCVQSQRVDALLLRAERQHGFEDEKDRVAFALHGMQSGASFDQHPRIRMLISELAHEGVSYADAAALLASEDWHTIRRETSFERSTQERQGVES